MYAIASISALAVLADVATSAAIFDTNSSRLAERSDFSFDQPAGWAALRDKGKAVEFKAFDVYSKIAANDGKTEEERDAESKTQIESKPDDEKSNLSVQKEEHRLNTPGGFRKRDGVLPTASASSEQHPPTSSSPKPELANGSPITLYSWQREKYRLAGTSEDYHDDEGINSNDGVTLSTVARSTTAPAVSSTSQSYHSKSTVSTPTSSRDNDGKSRATTSPTPTAGTQSSDASASASGENQQNQSSGAYSLRSISLRRAVCYVLTAQALTAALMGT